MLGRCEGSSNSSAPDVYKMGLHIDFRMTTLNNELPKSLGEFVIVHENVHLTAPSHKMMFKSFNDASLPDWIVREKSCDGLKVIQE